jgi:hypothetical protein
VLGVALLLGACGGGAGGGADAGASDGPTGACPLPEGRRYLISSLILGSPEVGFDLTGDGEIDNEFGKLSDGVRGGI